MTKVHIATLGCSANLADTQLMLGLLDEAGYEITESGADADICVVNMCSVKGEVSTLRRLKEIAPSQKLVITGCIPSTFVPQLEQHYRDASLLSTQNIHKIVDAVEHMETGERLIALQKSIEPQKTGMRRIRTNPAVSIVPILSGCDLHCTYCSVKLIKPTLISYSRASILLEIREAVKEGCKEIWLTSMDNAVYEAEQGKLGLPSLLREICSMPHDFKVRVGMMNPHHTLKQLHELAAAMQHPKIYQFLHLPVQSGSNRILHLMGRRNTTQQFCHIVSAFRSVMPNITLATDIIAGFPTESEEDFQQTTSLLKGIKPDVVNISRYAPRPGTASLNIAPPISSNEKKRRSKILTELCAEIGLVRNKAWLGWSGAVTIIEQGKNNTMQGRNFAYKPVVIPGGYPLGYKVTTQITAATAHDLRGKI